MREILDDVRAWEREGCAVAVATVVEVKRSTPRPPGAKMAINSRGDISGSVSGGCVEGAVAALAERILAGEECAQLVNFGYADEEAWDVGLPCGGEVTVWIERYEP